MPELAFKGWMAANNVSQKEIATLLGISYRTANAKVNGKQDWTIAQLRILKAHYGVSADMFVPCESR